MKNGMRFSIMILVGVILAVPLFARGAAETDTFSIQMATPSMPEDSNVKAFFVFKEIVERESDGRIQVEVMHSGQLGGQRDYIEGLQLGSIQMAEVNTAVLSAVEEKFMVFDMPYISRSVEHLIEVIDGGVGDTLSQALEAKTGIKIIGWMVRTPRSVYSSRGAIQTADDFRGLKIRVMESPVMIKTMELLGAIPVPIAATERYMALQTRVVDAAENSPPLIITEKEYEVTSHVSLTEHFITPNVIAIDGRFFNRLPADLQQIVVDAGREAAQFAVAEDMRQLNAAIGELESRGMSVNVIQDKSTFIQRVQPIYAEYEGRIGRDLIDAFLATN